jgi:hypothetical protein
MVNYHTANPAACKGSNPAPRRAAWDGGFDLGDERPLFVGSHAKSVSGRKLPTMTAGPSGSPREQTAARSGPWPYLAPLILAAAGFLVWTVLCFVAGRTVNGVFDFREAWAGPAYWLVGLPILTVISAITGYLVPRRVWRWPLWIALGQVVAMTVVHPADSTAALPPLEAAFVGLPLVLFVLLITLIAAIIRRDGWSPELFR